MRKIIRLSDQEDMCFPADDRIYIGISLRARSLSLQIIPVILFQYLSKK